MIHGLGNMWIEGHGRRLQIADAGVTTPGRRFPVVWPPALGTWPSPPCYVDDMDKVRIEADLPAALAAQARAFVAEGCATDLDDLLAEALRRFLESHAHDLTAAFLKEDVQWGLHGDD